MKHICMQSKYKLFQVSFILYFISKACFSRKLRLLSFCSFFWKKIVLLMGQYISPEKVDSLFDIFSPLFKVQIWDPQEHQTAANLDSRLRLNKWLQQSTLKSTSKITARCYFSGSLRSMQSNVVLQSSSSQNFIWQIT